MRDTEYQALDGLALATLADRFEAAGLVPFARTTVPEFCMAPNTEAARNGGPTRNPWDPTRSSGGSSGGAAAAYLELLAKPPRKMRIIVWRSAFNGVPVAPECVAAVERAAALCRELGHEVVDGTPPDIEYDAFVLAHANVLAGNIVLSVDTRLGLTGQALGDDDLEPVLRQGYDYGKTLPAAQYIGSVNRFHATPGPARQRSGAAGSPRLPLILPGDPATPRAGLPSPEWTGYGRLQDLSAIPP
ncbi:Asp-tRNA(Asn)/Glu-tRNA(Gln) amidotransferase A subunit family amidase [Achromobacter deleyi]|uniref:amidase family protein n=1 Tax=Achromobacter TaxID=222 RepID=UPI001E3B4EE0|nr:MULTISPECIES: amidase family protein [Achromobacter]MDR6601346.1 Asp-tRNA(Asn)/Glu-tRNA(Gln) amidotransferase A subunit family amidase [Achromobacter deleyi]